MALLITDMISDWRFPNGSALRAAARTIAPRIKRLKARCREAGLPVIYANDNHGRWRSDFRQMVDFSIDSGDIAAKITGQLVPEAQDYFILKPKHSAFFATPLQILLEHLQVHRLLIAGVAADQCVLVTAIDARMRDMQVIVPRDCVGAETGGRHSAALRYFRNVLEVATVLSADVELTRGRSGKSG